MKLDADAAKVPGIVIVKDGSADPAGWREYNSVNEPETPFVAA
jgi:hypothetical protein